jgi:hypothetical protein
MLILPKHSIDKKSTFLPVLPNAYTILKSNDFKNTIFKNAIFKITLIKIALPNGPHSLCHQKSLQQIVPKIIFYSFYLQQGAEDFHALSHQKFFCKVVPQ